MLYGSAHRVKVIIVKNTIKRLENYITKAYLQSTNVLVEDKQYYSQFTTPQNVNENTIKRHNIYITKEHIYDQQT